SASCSPVIAPEKQFRGGGKRGRVCLKACEELRELRALARTPGVLAADRLARLAELERQHAAAVERARAARGQVSSAGVSSAVAWPVERREYRPPVPPLVLGTQPAGPVAAAPRISDPAKFAEIKGR